MLKSFLTIALLQLSVYSYCQLPTLDWLKTTENVYGSFLSSDLNGNIYMAGSFNGTHDFDPGSGSAILTSTSVSSGEDCFLSKFDSDGNFLWVKQWGFNFDPGGNFAFMTDSSGNIYMTGKYGGTTDFDPGTSVFTLTSNSDAAFLMKLNSSGDFLAAKRLIEGSLLINFSLYVMPDGEVTVAGNYGGTATFISGETKTSANRDHFLINLDSGLNYHWLKCWGGPVSESLHDHERDAQGNIYFAGSFNGSTDLDPGIEHMPYPTNGNDDIIFSKLTPDGELIWAKVIGSTGSERALRLEVDYSGNVYLSGVFGSNTLDFDLSPTQVYNLVLTNGNSFTAKYTNNGEFQWANTFRPIDPNILGASFSLDNFSVDTYGNSFISGSFRGIVDLDPSSGTSTLDSNGDLSFFIRKLDPSGNFSYTFKLGTSETLGSRAPLCFGLNNSFYTLGVFDRTIDFEPGTGVFNVTPAPLETYKYLLKMNECSNGSIESVSECQNYTWPLNNSTYTASGTYSHVLSNTEGCDSIVLLDLTINPNTSVTQIGATISAVLSGASYQWINCNSGNSPVSGATSQSFSPAANGSYAVIVTQNGCSDTSSCITMDILNLDEETKGTNWTIYPNPAQESVTVTSGQNIENTSIKVFNLNGAQLPVSMIQSSEAKSIEININHLPNGIYFVNLISEGENQYIRFIKN